MSEDHRLSHAEIIERYLKPGDTITHIRCMGCIQEHVYTGKDGGWLCGYALDKLRNTKPKEVARNYSILRT